MVVPQKRLIIVCGMAHSGTTEMARVLGSAPGWSNYVSGTEDHLLECDELLHRDAFALRRALGCMDTHGVVVKRPWLEIDWAWCVREFPDAVFLVMLRSFPDLWASWNKPNSAGLSRGLVGCTPAHALGVWDDHIRAGSALVTHAPMAAWVDFNAFARHPALLTQTLARFDIEAAHDFSTLRAVCG